MSLLEPYRKMREEIRRLKLENEILKNEVIVLKNLLFNLELDEIGSIEK